MPIVYTMYIIHGHRIAGIPQGENFMKEIAVHILLFTGGCLDHIPHFVCHACCVSAYLHVSRIAMYRCWDSQFSPRFYIVLA